MNTLIISNAKRRGGRREGMGLLNFES
jgi:hypothetical protein